MINDLGRGRAVPSTLGCRMIAQPIRRVTDAVLNSVHTMTAREPSLLVFTLSPAGECSRRRLLPARLAHMEHAFHRRNLEVALSAGRANDCRLEVSSPRALAVDRDVHQVGQRGGTFGERFRAAIRGAAARAEGPLLVVGSDAPGLGRKHLSEALERLGDDSRRVVIGPSPDGGFYLLATNRPLDAELARVRWCSHDTLATLIVALQRSGLGVSLLEPLRDLDHPCDLMTWIAGEARSSLRWQRYASLLRRLLLQLARPDLPTRVGHGAPGFDLAFAGRAPPL